MIVQIGLTKCDVREGWNMTSFLELASMFRRPKSQDSPRQPTTVILDLDKASDDFVCGNCGAADYIGWILLTHCPNCGHDLLWQLAEKTPSKKEQTCAV